MTLSLKDLFIQSDYFFQEIITNNQTLQNHVTQMDNQTFNKRQIDRLYPFILTLTN
jgi:hypothetical protein